MFSVESFFFPGLGWDGWDMASNYFHISELRMSQPPMWLGQRLGHVERLGHKRVTERMESAMDKQCRTCGSRVAAGERYCSAACRCSDRGSAVESDWEQVKKSCEPSDWNTE